MQHNAAIHLGLHWLRNAALYLGLHCLPKYPVWSFQYTMGEVYFDRVRTDLEKSLNLTLVLENSWNLKVSFVLEFCKVILENMN